MAWTGWLTYAAAAEPYWPGVVDVDDEDQVGALLASARVQCEAFAPGAPEGDDVEVSESWRLAQGLQARALWRSGVAGSGDRIGGDELAVTVFPMDWTVKALLRPARKPVVG